MSKLINQLINYSKTKAYPFHMPGHKRNIKKLQDANILYNIPYNVDITEINGFDELYCADGILKESMDNGAKVFKCDECFYLVNGSTGGILTAISAVTDFGDKIIVARNCHKAVYNTIFLRNLKPYYIYPSKLEEWGINGAVNADEVKDALESNKDCKAVIITSPTYDGIVSDIVNISKLCHSYNIPLIVDEAHGAHFGFDKYFYKSAISLGADLVINSLHKTLPALTQTGILKFKNHNNIVNIEKVKKYYGIYQTSSPSYILMSSIDLCIDFLYNNNFLEYINMMKEFYFKCNNLKCIRVMDFLSLKEKEIIKWDLSKIVISLREYNKKENKNISGKILMNYLRKEHSLELEMQGFDYVLAMTSVMDTKEGLDRLYKGILDFDRLLFDGMIKEEKINLNTQSAKEKLLKLKNKKAKAFIYVYPPGIPILTPEEVCTDHIYQTLLSYINAGMNVKGLD